MKSFLALITPMTSGAHPDHELPKPQPPAGGKPPGIWGPTDPRPTPPIHLPLPPGAPPPQIDNTLPGDQPGIDNTLPGDQPEIDNSLPLPPNSGDWKPVFIWGPTDPRPTPPIHIPPDVTVDGEKLKVHAIWTEENGWETIVVIKPDKPAVTPSRRR